MNANLNRRLALFFSARSTVPLRGAGFVRLSATKTGGTSLSVEADLSPYERTVLDNTLRVDHAGEVAANYIYRGQMSVLGNDDCRVVLQVAFLFLFILSRGTI
jgi:demethoxyubiquinone hydroxylase (CLK1/Coq7/Cat5 family)